MQALSNLIVILAIAVSPVIKYVEIYEEILYTRSGCLNRLNSCQYMTQEQMSWSDSDQFPFVANSVNYTAPTVDIGIVYNGIKINIEELVASILFLRVKKCNLSITVIYDVLPVKQVNVIRFLPNTKVLQSNNISSGLLQIDYKQILYVNEAIYFLTDPSAVDINMFFPSTKKFHINDKIWATYGHECYNQYIPSSKFVSFNKTLLKDMKFNSLDIPIQLYMNTLNLNVFQFEEFPNLVGTLRCPHSLMYNIKREPLFIDADNLDIQSIIRFTIQNCNSYLSVKYNGCFKVVDYGIFTQRTISDVNMKIKTDLETITDAIDMSSKFVHLEPYQT
eukprot:NODE_172_length_15988_cov_0.603940.p4 type:complete len:334 gc:universal NODE_172_length_15988_cov_0.603940:10211-9210(-)